MMKPSRTLLRGASFVALALILPAVSGVAAERSDEARLQDWFDRMDAHYTANPALQDTPSSGWKPYNRYRWFIEQRMLDGELPAPDARWRAWEVKREREQGRGAFDRTWFSLGPRNFAGRMLAIDFDPDDPSTVYIGGADGGVWKSTDGGATWTPMSDHLPSIAIGGLAVGKTTGTIVIGTGEGTNNVDRVRGVGILRSTDGAVTWETTGVSFPESFGRGFHFVECGPTGTFLAGSTLGLWRSSDDGVTWTQVHDDHDWFDGLWKPDDPNVVYLAKGEASIGNGVKKSTDDGQTWSGVNNGLPQGFQMGKLKLAVSADEPDWVYVIINGKAVSPTLGIWRTTDAAGTWTAQNTSVDVGGGQGWYNLTLAADPNDATRIFAGGVSLYRSTNSGVSLFQIGGNVHVDHHDIAYEPGSNSSLWVMSDGGAWRSPDDGSSWVDRNSGLVTYQFYDICVNNGPTPYYIMGGTQDNGTDKWSGTTTWSNGLGGDGMVCNIDPSNGTTVYAEYQLGIHRKNFSSGSGSWGSIMTGISGEGAWVTPVDEDQNLGNHLYTSTAEGIFRTTTGGSPWVQVDDRPATWISISPVDGNVVWTVAGNARLTTDDGVSWAAASTYGFIVGGATKILAHPTDVNTAFVTFSSYGDVAHIAMTTDLGVSWTDVSGDFPSQPVNAIAVNRSNPNQWFIGTDIGVWLSENGGVHWGPYSVGLPNAVVSDLEIQNSLQKLVAGTHGRGAWEVDLPSLPGTGVEVAVGPAERNLMLDPPSPNPVTDRTLLRYAAKHAGPIHLEIYDVSGRLVSSLADFPRGDGIIRTTPWFTDDVPSGVYFAVLRAGELRRTQKVVVAK